jgi:SSS family solute:Na+ symporter
LHHGLTLPKGAVAGIKGGWIALTSTYPSEMAQNFWTAIWAWLACFLVTIAVSLITAPRREEELKGLVYSLTPRPASENLPWYKQPGPLGACILALTLMLNIIFW